MPLNKPRDISTDGMTAPLNPAVVDVVRYFNLDVSASSLSDFSCVMT